MFNLVVLRELVSAFVIKSIFVLMKVVSAFSFGTLVSAGNVYFEPKLL